MLNKLNGKSKKYLIKFLDMNKHKLTQEQIIQIQNMIVEEENINKEFIKKMENSYLYKLAGLQLIRENKAEVFHTSIGISIWFVNIKDRLSKMIEILDIANTKNINIEYK